MLTREENELVTRTGPGTPMGEVMRRYWMPALLDSELPEPDCPPVRVTLLGERLVAFRDTNGRVGLLEEFCAHRRASLFLGRNEECGLRCVYHGWKYDVEGNCVDMPNEPPESNFKQKIRLRSYPTVELGGLIWAYMGPGDRMPPPPRFEWATVAEGFRHVSKTWQESNWLQALEGGIDSSHASFLHRALTPNTTRAGIKGYRVRSTAPKEELVTTDYGFLYASLRPVGAEGNFVRSYHYVMPFHQFFPFQLPYGERVSKPVIRGHLFVPMDDVNCMVYNFMYRFGTEPLSEKERLDFERNSGRGPGEQTASFQKVRNKANQWLIDRQVQKSETYTGIDGINVQDHAIQESMGPIVDRTREHLGSTDQAIILARRLLIQAAATVKAGGDPPGVGTSYYRVRAIEKLVPKGVDWREAMRDEIYPGGGAGVI